MPWGSKAEPHLQLSQENERLNLKQRHVQTNCPVSLYKPDQGALGGHSASWYKPGQGANRVPRNCPVSWYKPDQGTLGDTLPPGTNQARGRHWPLPPCTGQTRGRSKSRQELILKWATGHAFHTDIHSTTCKLIEMLPGACQDSVNCASNGPNHTTTCQLRKPPDAEQATVKSANCASKCPIPTTTCQLGKQSGKHTTTHPVNKFKGLPSTHNYVDDDRSFTRIFRPGVRFVKEKMKYIWTKEKEVEDIKMNIDLVELTQGEILKYLNSMSTYLSFTMEYFSDYEDGYLPTLDFKIGVDGEGLPTFRFYEKTHENQVGHPL